MVFMASHVDQSMLRDGDVIISSGIKAGTTFTRAIVHQIITKGSDDFDDLTDEIPFIQFHHHPYETDAQLVKHFERLVWSHMPIRAIATHEVASLQPLDPKIRYVVTFRSPHEVHDSYLAFYNLMSDDIRELWSGCILPRVSEEQFEHMWTSYLSQFLVANHINGWWPHRGNKNVLFLHYSDMTKDLSTTALKIAKHIGVTLNSDELNQVVNHTSFSHMKANSHRYDGWPSGWPRTFIEQGWIRPGFRTYEKESALTRHGKSGEYVDDERTKKYDAQLRMQISDEAALRWLLKGGDLPK